LVDIQSDPRMEAIRKSELDDHLDPHPEWVTPAPASTEHSATAPAAPESPPPTGEQP